MRIRTLALLAAAAGLGFAAPSLAQWTYRADGPSGFMQDLDAGDGVDFSAALEGTWSLEFAVPAQSGLTLAGNVQNQGGSRTTYNGATITSLVVNTATGPRTIISEPTPAQLRLWDRSTFRGGTDYFEVIAVIGTTTVQLSASAGNVPPDTGYDQLFIRGTPSPNTLDADGLPTAFDRPEVEAAYLDVAVSIDGTLPLLPGRGRYNGSAQRLYLAGTTPPPLGACCASDGSCVVRIQTNCAASWISGAVCEPDNPCAQPPGACCAADQSCQVVPEADCTGSFLGAGTVCDPTACVPPTFTITTTVVGNGSIVSDPPGIDCPGSCQASFDADTTVRLTPVPGPGSRFAGWTGDVCDGTAPCDVYIDSDYSQEATFACLADFDASGTRDVADIFAFLSAWFAGSTTADVDASGTRDVADIFAFLSAWFAGC